MNRTYEQPFRSICTRMIHVAKELERVWGRQRALEVIGRGIDRNLVERKRKQVTEKDRIKDFEIFKALQKKVSRPF